GAWGALDGLYVLAAHDAQAARINWKDPANVATTINAPTFTADRGYQGDGSSSSLDTNFNPVSASQNYQQDACHLGVWPLTDRRGSNDLDLGSSADWQRLYINSCNNTFLASRVNSTTAVTTNLEEL